MINKEVRKVLIYFSMKYNGDSFQIMKAVSEKEKIKIENIKEVENFIKNLKSHKINIITVGDKNYPEKLKKCNQIPIVLYEKNGKFTEKPVKTVLELKHFFDEEDLFEADKFANNFEGIIN